MDNTDDITMDAAPQPAPSMSATANKPYALVTGGTSGIGYELVKLLAADGYHLILVARNSEELETTAAELKTQYNIKVTTMARDLFDYRAAFEVHRDVQAQGLNVTILVNDAGQGVYGEFINTDIERELDIIHLNICSLVVLTKLFLQDMVNRGSGKILNVSSIASKTPGPWQSVYHATKAFVQSFSQAVREEVKDSGVTITTLLPGATKTDFFNKANMQESKIVVEGEDKMSDPADVAKDGYDAMIKGDDMVVSGFQNKMQVAMAAVTPDTTLAAITNKKQEPAGKNKDDQESFFN